MVESTPQESVKMPSFLDESGSSEPESSESSSDSGTEECECADTVFVSDETILQIND